MSCGKRGRKIGLEPQCWDTSINDVQDPTRMAEIGPDGRNMCWRSRVVRKEPAVLYNTQVVLLTGVERD